MAGARAARELGGVPHAQICAWREEGEEGGGVPWGCTPDWAAGERGVRRRVARRGWVRRRPCGEGGLTCVVLRRVLPSSDSTQVQGTALFVVSA